MTEKLRPWWKKMSKPMDAVIITMLVALFALVVVVITGYAFHLGWTGLGQRTLWDWLQLLVIPAVLAVGGYLFNYTTSRNEHDIALDNQREAALQGYIDRMSELLLDKGLHKSAEDDGIRNVARARTLIVLPQLDGNRKGSIIQFLAGSNLIAIVDLTGADLSHANLPGANLMGAKLSHANLSHANLSHAYLNRANLTRADFSNTNLSDAALGGVNLMYANLCKANLHIADLSYTNLSHADLSGTDLNHTNLCEVNLSDANLSSAKVTTELLNQAKSLKGTTMPDRLKHQ